MASVCVLLYQGPLSPTGKDRLRAMAETNDGFNIARRDLEIRGPGEFMGARQSRGKAVMRCFALLTWPTPRRCRSKPSNSRRGCWRTMLRQHGPMCCAG